MLERNTVVCYCTPTVIDLLREQIEDNSEGHWMRCHLTMFSSAVQDTLLHTAAGLLQAILCEAVQRRHAYLSLQLCHSLWIPCHGCDEPFRLNRVTAGRGGN